MKDPTGKAAPAGGFQNLGWYSGYQYYNGSFAPTAGSIHPNSPQQGAGKPVSAEVNRQTSVAAGLAPNANQEYVDRLNAQPAANPSAFYGGGAAPASGANFGAPATSGGGAGVGDFGAPAAINLPDLYKNLYASAGISDIEKQYSDMEKAFIETKGKINDNPFLSEATRVGRVAKLETLFNERTANIKNDIATKKADIETQINLATKQFDINSQQARDNLSRFNTLLEAGAYDNASGDDIANATRLTGLSSAAINSAVSARKDKNRDTQVVTSTADSGEVTAVVIDKRSGAIISKTSLGKIGNAQTGAKATDSDKKTYYMDALRTDASKGLTLTQVYQLYTGYLDPDTILQLYNANSRYGPAKESNDYLARTYGVKSIKTGL